MQAVATSTAATALCDVETNRSGRAFELIAQWTSCRVRQGRDHPGEFKRDPVAVQSLVIEQWLLGREGSGGRVVCVLVCEIQGGAPIMSDGLIAVLTLTDGDLRNSGGPHSHARDVANDVTATQRPRRVRFPAQQLVVLVGRL